MRCPKCAFEAGERGECPRCGVIFAKVRERRPPAVPAPTAAEAVAVLPALPRLRFGRVPLRRRVQLFRQLATLERAGVPIAEALLATAEREPSAAARLALREIRDALVGGATLREAVAAQGVLLDETSVLLLSAGEAAGRLAETWEALADRAELRLRLARDLALALFYPTLLLVIGCFLLPLRLLLLEGTGAYLRAALLPIGVLAGVVLAALAVRALFRPSPALSTALHRVPLVGPLLERLAWARAANALGELCEAGLPIRTCLGHAGTASASASVVAVFARAAERVVSGETLTAAFEASGRVPAPMLQILAAGERAGTLGHALRTFARGELETAIHGLKISVRAAAFVFVLGVFGYLGWRTFAQATEVRESLERVLDTVLESDGARGVMDHLKELERELR